MASTLFPKISCILLIVITVLKESSGSPAKRYFTVTAPEPCYLTTLDFKDPLNNLVLKIIHEIQSHMHDGIPSLGIPPLDPLNISKYNFDMNECNIKVYGKLRDVFVRNLSTFNVTNINTHLLKRSVNVSIEIPNLLIQGKYSLKGKALSFFPISGSGPFVLIPKDTKATIYTTLGYNGGHFVIDTFDYKVSIGDLYAKFDGIYGGGIISDLLNKILNGFGVSLFYRLEPLVHEQIKDELIADINRLLRELKLGDLTNEITSRTLCI